MASGRTHARVAASGVVASVVAAPIVAGAYGAEVAAGLVCGAVCGWLTTPDIDLITLTREERRMRRAVPFFGRLWVAYWAAYGSFFSHRGISHAPVLGTLTRAVYALWWVVLLPQPPAIEPAFVAAAFAAWCAQDIGHLVFDKFGFSWRL